MFLCVVRDIPVTVPIEQVLIGADKERAGAAGWIENAQPGGLFRRFVLEQFADRLLDDVLDDVSGRVVDATGFLDLRLVFYFRAVPFSERDDLAEKLFIDLPKDIGRQDRELVGTFGIIEATNDFL